MRDPEGGQVGRPRETGGASGLVHTTQSGPNRGRGADEGRDLTTVLTGSTSQEVTLTS